LAASDGRSPNSLARLRRIKECYFVKNQFTGQSNLTINPHAVTKIDYEAARAPLLLIAGTVDHTVPESVVKANVHLQQKSSSITAFKEFPAARTTSSASRAGKRWPTSRSSGRCIRPRSTEVELRLQNAPAS
jgi:hypothetical protein